MPPVGLPLASFLIQFERLIPTLVSRVDGLACRELPRGFQNCCLPSQLLVQAYFSERGGRPFFLNPLWFKSLSLFLSLSLSFFFFFLAYVNRVSIFENNNNKKGITNTTKSFMSHSLNIRYKPEP